MPALIKLSRLFSDELLNQYRQQGDVPADAVIAAITQEGGPSGLRLLMGWLADTTDLTTDKQPSVVGDFFRDHASLPTWADPKRMGRAMAFFKKHAGPIGLALGTYSLPYTYMGANGVQLLWLTERIKNDTARRLQETGEWVFGVNNAKEWSFAAVSSSDGRTAQIPKAIARTLKIRLIHAGARWFGLHSGRWNMDWGYPVNQEDMAGTNLAFSYIVLQGLRKTGVTVTDQEEEDYLHHANVIAAVNGISDELLPDNLREAYQLDKAIAKRQFRPSEAGVGLTRSLLNAIGNLGGAATNRPDATRNLAAAQMRLFLGDAYADSLGIPAVPVEKRIVNVMSRLPIFPTTFPGL
jgi:ER-bound oxygenase mpaB/B'/Rubber oxygenase, catalytic domain